MVELIKVVENEEVWKVRLIVDFFERLNRFALDCKLRDEKIVKCHQFKSFYF